MTERYYDDRRGSRDSFTTTTHHQSQSRPRYDDYESYARDYDRRSPSRDYNHRTSSRDIATQSGDYESYARDYDRNSPSREVAVYDDERHHRRQRSLSPSHEHHSHHNHHERRTSRQIHAEHHPGKDLAATILGAAVGGEAGRKFGEHSKMATAAGVLIGAWGGHELEKSWQAHETKKEDKRRYSHSGRG